MGDVCIEITVGFVGPMTAEYREAGVPFLRSMNIEPFRINKTDLKFVSREFHARINKSRLRIGDLVIVRTGAPGTAAVVPEWMNDGNCSDLVIVRPGPKVDAAFLCYYVNAVTHHIVNEHVVGAVQQHFNVGAAKGLKIPLPPLLEQRAIARVLGGLDDKIELNRRMNRTLEDLARGLFRSWFVDFDPVIKGASATAPAAPNPRVASPGVGLPIARPLWPKRLIDSPLGPIPEGWRVGTVGELCAWIVSGGTPSRQKAEYWTDATIRWFKTGELTDGPLLEAEEKISQVGLDESACRLWQAGTVLFALYASPTLGRMGVLEEPGTSNQACAALWVKPEYGLGFLVQTLFLARDELQRISSGAAQQNINQGILRGHQVIVPSPDVAAEFSRIVNPWYKQQVSLARESCSLAALRDALLPQLLSGDIRLREAQRTIDDSLQANGQPLRAAQRAAARVKGSE